MSQLLSTNYVSSLFVILHWPIANEHRESTQNLTFWIQKMTPDFGAIIIELREKRHFFIDEYCILDLSKGF